MFAAVVVVDLLTINFNTLPARICHRLFTLKPDFDINGLCQSVDRNNEKMP